MAKLLEQLINELTKQFLGASALEKASKICDWIAGSITYDQERAQSIHDDLDDGIPYHPEITLERGMGICSDMAVLYVAIARKMGLNAHFACVSVDHKGNTTGHACAVVDLPIGRKLADPAYGKFDIRHKKYYIYEPEIKRYDNRVNNGVDNRVDNMVVQTYTPILQLLRPILRYAAALFLAAGAFGGLSSIISCEGKNTEIKRLEFEGGTKFISQNGVLELRYDRDTANLLKEYLFFCEAKGTALDDSRVLEKYLEADTNRNSQISLQEAMTALELARNAYYKKKN